MAAMMMTAVTAAATTNKPDLYNQPTGTCRQDAAGARSLQ